MKLRSKLSDYIISSLDCPIIGKIIMCVIKKNKMLTFIQVTRD